MSLSLIVGSSGSGKSTYIYQKIIAESMENKDKNFLVIVPEQYTMSTQRLLVSMHPNHCIMNIDVLSFDRLAYRVFEELGVSIHSVLDDTGKSLVIRKLVDDNIDSLGALRRNMTRISYITQVKSLISELTQYNITPDKLKEMIALPTMSESFRRKASDLLVMYEAFLGFIQDKYVTTETILATLDTVISDSKIVDGSTIVLDGFTGFTPIQYTLVEHFLEICDEVVVTITGDIDETLFQHQDEDALFSMSSEFAIKMSNIAKRANADINEPYFVNHEFGWLSNNPVMTHLEKNIFRDKTSAYEGDDASNVISLVSLRSIRDELSFVAMSIVKLIRQGYRYRDIAIVCPNLEQYRYILPDIFSDYGIPYFVDAKTEILFHPFVEAVDSVFDIFENGFKREDVFRFLRTGMTDLTTDEIDYLENYILSTGIRGKKKYFHPFAIRSNSYSQDEDMLRVNAIREKFINSFIQLDKSLKKDATVRQIATGLYRFITSFNCEEKINKRKLFHENNGNAIAAKEYSQIYAVVMDILDKMVSILECEVMDFAEFAEIYKAGLASAAIGVIPPDYDSIIVGDIERTRLSNIKVLLCMGASDDAIPMKVENGGILSQLEREQLLEAGFEMAPSDRQKSFRQRFYLYLMLTKPSDKLFITMPRVGGDGKGVNPSYLYDVIKKLLPGIALTEIEEFAFKDRILSKKGATDYLVELITKAATFGFEMLDDSELAQLNDLISWYKTDSQMTIEELINAAFFVHSGETVSEDIMLAVNEAFNQDETVRGSVSRFESYSECAYRYFLTYILRLNDREEFQLSSIDMGNFYHEALERYSDSLKQDDIKWSQVTDEQKEAHIELAIGQTFESMAKVATLEDDTQKYIVETMKKTLDYAIGVITEQVKRGDFEPELFEEKINTKIYDKSTNEIVADLVGKVDRIDLTDGSDRAVRIIDYKSSQHKMDLSAVYHGLSLQLPIYMGVVLNKLKEKYPSVTYHPSAMLYYEMANKFVDLDKGSDSFIEEQRFTQNKMQGLLSTDESDLAANDSTVGTEDGMSRESLIVPYKLKKDGTLDSSTNGISRDEMNTLIEYSFKKAADIAENIIAGEFEPSPARLGANDACAYCGFNGVCHFKDGKAGYEARNLKKYSDKSELIEMMKDELNQDE